MTANFLPVSRLENKDGSVEYYIEADSECNGLDSLVQYLQKHWQAVVVESNYVIYSRHWVPHSNGPTLGFPGQRHYYENPSARVATERRQYLGEYARLGNWVTRRHVGNL